MSSTNGKVSFEWKGKKHTMLRPRVKAFKHFLAATNAADDAQREDRHAAVVGHRIDALESVAGLGGACIVLDDGSTDDTRIICRRFPFVQLHRQLGMEQDETRDRTYLYKEALKLDPTWIYVLDGDEVLAPSTPAKMLRAIEKCPDEVNVIALLIGQMATRPEAKKQMWFGPGSIDTAFRLFRVRDAATAPELGTEFAGGLHCGILPPMAGGHVKLKLNAFVKAYGYEDAEQQAIKLKNYEIDPRAHAARVRQLVDFNTLLPTRWNDGADCREMGKGGTVSY